MWEHVGTNDAAVPRSTVLIKLTELFKYWFVASAFEMQFEDECPECSGPLSQSAGEIVCRDCGLVVDEDLIDPGPEWRSFEDDDKDRSRTGSPLTPSRHDRGLGSTDIGRDRKGRIPPRKRRRISRWRLQHNRAQFSSKAERNQMEAFSEIGRIIDRMGLPLDIRDTACELFRDAQREGIVQGRSLEGFAAAAVYASCRLLRLTRTKDEVVEVAKAGMSELSNAYDAMNRDLSLPIGAPDPREFLPRYASELDIPTPVEERAKQLVGKLDEDFIVGRNPSGVAAGCLYAAARERGHELTQKDAAKVAAVTPVTLRTTFKALKEEDLVEA